MPYDTGGNKTCTPDTTINLVKDATPPVVKAVTPMLGSNSPANSVAAISAKFSKPVSVATLQGSNMQLYSAGPDGILGTADDILQTGGSVAYQETSNTALLTFAVPLASGSYRAVLSSNVTVLNGNHLSADYAWNFDIGAITTWMSSTSGQWTDAGNWSRGAVPKQGDIVVIDKPGVTVTISSGDNAI